MERDSDASASDTDDDGERDEGTSEKNGSTKKQREEAQAQARSASLSAARESMKDLIRPGGAMTMSRTRSQGLTTHTAVTSSGAITLPSKVSSSGSASQLMLNKKCPSSSWEDCEANMSENESEERSCDESGKVAGQGSAAEDNPWVKPTIHRNERGALGSHGEKAGAKGRRNDSLSSGMGSKSKKGALESSVLIRLPDVESLLDSSRGNTESDPSKKAATDGKKLSKNMLETNQEQQRKRKGSSDDTGASTFAVVGQTTDKVTLKSVVSGKAAVTAAPVQTASAAPVSVKPVAIERKPLLMQKSQTDLVQLAFAGPDFEDDFNRLKRQAIDDELGVDEKKMKILSSVKAGWGDWAGPGASGMYVVYSTY